MLVAVVVALQLVHVGDWVEPLLERVDRLGWAAPPLFILLHAAAIVLLVPGILFPLGAGFLFGTAAGTVYSVAGKVLGGLLSFLLARHVLGGRLLGARRLEKRSAGADQGAKAGPLEGRLAALDRLSRRLPEGGWRNVLLIRLVPAIPFKISNYVFGWSRFSLRDFLIGTVVGAIPFSWINAYLGSLGADVASLAPGARPHSQTEWILFALGAAISLGAAVAIVMVALRILRRGRDGNSGSSNQEPRT